MPTDPLLTDTSLIRLLRESRSDDPERFRQGLERFYEQYMPAIFAWCRQRGLSEPDALDVGHDLMVDIGRKLKSYSPDRGGRFSNWLYIVTRNAVLDFFNQRFPRGPLLDAADESSGEDLLAELVAAFEREMRLAALAQVESAADETNRQIIELRFRQRLSGDDVAERLGIRPAALYQRVRRLRVELQRVQEELEASGPFFLAPAAAPDESAP